MSAVRTQADVLVRVIVLRTEYELRTDADGTEDYFLVKREVVSEREWWEKRAAPSAADGEADAQ